METHNHSWDKAKAQFKGLWEEVQFSPDLTRTQKQELIKDYQEELKEIRQQAVERFALMGRDVGELRGTQQLPEIEAEFLELGKTLDELD